LKLVVELAARTEDIASVVVFPKPI